MNRDPRPALRGASSLLSAYKSSHHEAVVAKKSILPVILHYLGAVCLKSVYF